MTDCHPGYHEPGDRDEFDQGRESLEPILVEMTDNKANDVEKET